MNYVKKERVTRPQLKMQVFHENIYEGKELMTIIGIREKEVELFGDYSGGTNKTEGSSWIPLEGTFRLKKVCDQHVKFGTCTLPNVHCGSPDCEPYLSNWGHYVDGKLTDEAKLL